MSDKRKKKSEITALFAASDGEIYDAPGVEALARIDDRIIELEPEQGDAIEIFLLMVQTAEGWSLYYSY